MPDVPHLAFPVRLFGTSFLSYEQDTIDDIASCVELILLYEPGSREMLPEFGTQDPTFETQPIDLQQIAAAVERWEPRVHTLLSQAPDVLDAMVVRVLAQLKTKDDQ
jgi:phage baseplate assembly protein W